MAVTTVQSRKVRKKLEKIVLRKKSKVNRSNLLAQLKECQLQPDQHQLMHSTSSMQTKGLKRFLNDDDDQLGTQRLNEIDRAEQCLDASMLVKIKRRRLNKQKTRTQSSSSEDTDAISTDTEIYYSSSDEAQDEKDLASVSEPTATVCDTSVKISNTNSPVNQPKATTIVEKPSESTVLSETIDKLTSNKPAIPREPAVYVPVMRDPTINKARLDLPIIGEEQNIMENIRYNDIVIVTGETGSGKTTQIPQFLYEAGYALNGKMIGVTEPRRVAAVSMSERVARELNLTSEEVSYQIRFSGNVTDKTSIKFMTDGVLLREFQKDCQLPQYSVLIIDEAHERSVFSDILIGLLSRIVPLRAKHGNPLKVVIMSATLRVSDFTENSFLFRQPPPIINIETRQYPVTVEFAKKTPDNYLQAAYRKVCSIHSKMPKGGILVFVTSQMDVKVLCKKLRQKFPNKSSTVKQDQQRISKSKRKFSLKQMYDGDDKAVDSHKLTIENLKQDIEINSEPEEDEDEQYFSRSSKSSADLLDWSDIGSDSEEEEGIVHCTKSPLYCLGLYAMLPLEKQRLVFKNPPEGTRLCVVATNVAETSITIPNIRYVVDTGMEKTKVYDLVTGVSKFITTWTSKSSAHQRMGRAGRMGPGHCYRVYSSAVFTNDLPEHAEPRILQKPIEDVLLQMKSMKIDNVVNFPFPTRPSLEALKAAEKKLVLLGALDDKEYQTARFKDIARLEYSCKPTALGKAMSCFALSARCSKMIVLSPSDLLPHVICLVSALTVREMFLEGNKWRDLKKKWAGQGNLKLLGDFMLMIRAIIVSDSFGCSNKLCIENGLRTKAMLEIDKLRKQLTREINNNLNYPVLNDKLTLKKPTEDQSKILRQLLLSSYCDHVARKLPDGEIAEKDPNDPNKMVKKKLKHAYECMETEGPVYISSESVLKGGHPEFLIYKELYQGDKRMYMRDVAVIDPDWLPHYAPKLCTFGEPCEKPSPHYDKQIDQIVCNSSTTYGPLNWQIGSVEVPMHLVDSGSSIFKYFAIAFLSGEIISQLKKFSGKLLSSPNIITRDWSILQPRVKDLLKALTVKNVKCKRDLLKVWKSEKTSTCKYI